MENNSDSEERELERLVFGDDSAFQRGLQNFARHDKHQPTTELEDDDYEGLNTSLEGLHDDDIFMVDSVGSNTLIHQSEFESLSENEDENDDEDSHHGPAWVDSDDERLQISLASNTRLRKLRRNENEDVISGKEYSKRLRQQYLKLHPIPVWAKNAIAQSRLSEKRRNNNDIDSDSDESVSDDDISSSIKTLSLSELLRDAKSLNVSEQPKSKRRKLHAEVINIQRARHIALAGPSAITCIQIHPVLPLLIASGPSSKMDLYHLHSQAPEYSTHITSLVVKHTALTTTSFHPSPNDARIFLSARRRYFHVWNIAAGTVAKVTRMYGHSSEQQSMESFKASPDGEHVAFLGSSRKGGGVINLLNIQTLQWIAQARIDAHGGIADFSWWQNGKGLCIAGKDGQVTEWDLPSRRTVARWKDEGGFNTTTMALGGRSGRSQLGGDAWIALGSASGIVNIYSRRHWLASSTSSTTNSEANNTSTIPSTDNHNAFSIPTNPKPVKSLPHLTTPISHLEFSPDAQVLLLASRWKKDALRLVHIPSCTVYRNWPTAATPLGRISAVAWGEIAGSLKLVVGNEAGRIMCWDVRE